MKTFINNFSKEQTIVLLCSSLNINERKAAQIKKITKENIIWDKVVNIAKEQRVICLLYKNLKQITSDEVPEDILLKSKHYYLGNSKRNLSLSVRLVNIINLFKANNIAAVPFKGPAQAETVYEDIGLRSFNDLDILISRKDITKARDLLIKNNFLLTTRLPESQFSTYIYHENFFNFFDKTRNLNIDLHWEITGRYSLIPIYLEDIENRLIEINLVEQKISSLCFEDMLIYLCIHSTSHCWDKLESICSIAEIIKSNKIIDWQIIEKRAVDLKCKRMVHLGLALAKDLFDIKLPEEIEKEINNDRSLNRLEKQIIKKLFNNNKPLSESLSWRFSNLHFLIRDKLSDSINYGLRLLFCPTIKEWVTIPLPSKFLFLYFFIRPFRLIINLLKNILYKNK
jgi:Uncharacterised nucleotidyltransferase